MICFKFKTGVTETTAFISRCSYDVNDTIFLYNNLCKLREQQEIILTKNIFELLQMRFLTTHDAIMLQFVAMTTTV